MSRLIALNPDLATRLIGDLSMRSFFENLAAQRARRAKAAQIERELSAYSDRDLDDIRVARSDIPAIARGEDVSRG